MPLNQVRAREQTPGKSNSNEEGTAMFGPTFWILALFAFMAAGIRKLWGEALFAPDDPQIRRDTNPLKPLVFRAGEEARVVVHGEGDHTLDLFVYDANGNLTGRDTCTFDRCVAAGAPARKGNVHIQVGNLGAVYDQYRRWSN
jgi:hypothetical protein